MDINSRIREILEASPFVGYPRVQGGDPNRGAAGRAVPALPRGVDPYGSGLPSRGKLAARLSGLSDEGRKRYYREIGMRSRVASRGGVTGRLYPMESTGAAKGRYRAALARLGKRLSEIKPLEKPKPIVNPFTKPFKDKDKTVSEGSRGLARHERIIKALKKKSAALWSSTRGLKPSDPEYAKARAAQEAQPNRRERTANYSRLSRGQQTRDRVQISRERVRAGLRPQIPPATINATSVDDTGTFRVKSEPVSQHPDLLKRFKGRIHAPARVPKAVLKYRASSAAKAAAGKAKRSVSEGAVKDALADYLYSIPKEAIEELRPVMKIKSLNKRFAMITKVLKKHGFTQQFMGSMPTNVVNDYYDTFFG